MNCIASVKINTDKFMSILNVIYMELMLVYILRTEGSTGHLEKGKIPQDVQHY